MAFYRYIFGKQSNELLNQRDGNLNIASVCLSYLTLECFDDYLSDEDIIKNILSGDYVLLRYAANEWLEHVRRCGQHPRPELLQGLRGIISNFVEVRKNSSQTGFENRRHANMKFQPFQKWPDIYEFLIHMDDFIWKERGGLLEQNSEYLFSVPRYFLVVALMMLIYSFHLARPRSFDDFLHRVQNPPTARNDPVPFPGSRAGLHLREIALSIRLWSI